MSLSVRRGNGKLILDILWRHSHPPAVDGLQSLVSVAPSLASHTYCRYEFSVCDHVYWKVGAHIADIKNLHGDKAFVRLLPPQPCSTGPLSIVILLITQISTSALAIVGEGLSTV